MNKNNLIIIVIIVLIFSTYRVYSSNLWLEELKIHLQNVSKDIREHQEQNTKILLNHSVIIEKNQKEIMANKERDQELLNMSIKNEEIMLRNQKEMIFLKEENEKVLKTTILNQNTIQNIVTGFKDYKDKSGTMITEIYNKVMSAK